MSNCPVCQKPNPARPINANYWVATGEGKFGGHYERRDFCGMECVKQAPKYVKPKSAPKPKKQEYVYGDLAMVGLFLGQKPKKG